MGVFDRVLALTTNTIDGLESGSMPLSGVVRRAIRIARLRHDYANLLWLRIEMQSPPAKHQKADLVAEISPRFSRDVLERLWGTFVEAYIEERMCLSVDDYGQIKDEKKVAGLSIEEIEIHAKYYAEAAADVVTPQGLAPMDAYDIEKTRSSSRGTFRLLAADANEILARIRQRVHAFLSKTEEQLLWGQLASDVFESNRTYVDKWLADTAPVVLDQFSSIYRRLKEDDSEALSQALLTCRRILKTLADYVYPATGRKEVGPDGTSREMSKEKYVTRLWQYVHESVGGRAAGDLLKAQVSDLGNRIDRVYGLSSKGVHAQPSRFEANQCVIQTYLLVGDILRLSDGSSGIGYIPDAEVPEPDAAS